MARYINEDEFIAWVREHWCADCQNDNGLRCRACWIDDAIDIVEEAPEADVVPKSEVEETIRENESLAKTVNEASELIRKLRSKVEKSKTEIAREIFEEIETLLSLNSLQGDVFVGKYFDVDLENDIAELKKKYTEEKKDEN